MLRPSPITINSPIPEPSLWSKILSILALPGNTLLGEWAGTIVLPAQERLKNRSARNEANRIYDKAVTSSRNCIDFQNRTLQLNDGPEIDSIELCRKKHTGQAHTDRKYIINFVGNNMCYEQTMQEMIDQANELDCHVVGFNFRGVMDSQGKAKSPQDLVNDGIAQVQYLLDQGVQPENIVLKGHSLGGAIATLTAKHFHDQNQKLNVFNGRSFSTITNFIIGLIRTSNSGSIRTQACFVEQPPKKNELIDGKLYVYPDLRNKNMCRYTYKNAKDLGHDRIITSKIATKLGITKDLAIFNNTDNIRSLEERSDAFERINITLNQSDELKRHNTHSINPNDARILFPPKRSGHKETGFKKLLGWIAKPFVAFAMAFVGWEIDAASAYLALPEQNKEFMFVRSSKKDRQKYGNRLQDDTVITHYASLGKTVKDALPQKPSRTPSTSNRHDCQQGSITGPHFTLMPNHIESAVKNDFDRWQQAKRKWKDKSKTRKLAIMYKDQSAHINGHAVPDEMLENRHGQSGKDVFYDFFRKATQHESPENSDEELLHNSRFSVQ